MKETINIIEPILKRCTFGMGTIGRYASDCTIITKPTDIKEHLFTHESQCFYSEVFGTLSTLVNINGTDEEKQSWNFNAESIRDWASEMLPSKVAHLPDDCRNWAETALLSNIMGLCFEMHYESIIGKSFFFKEVVLQLLKENHFYVGWTKGVEEGQYISRKRDLFQLNYSGIEPKQLIVF